MHRIASLAFFALVLALLGTGCQTYTAQTQSMHSSWVAGQPTAAAAEFGKEADDCGDSKDAIVRNLEAGTAYRVAGNITNSSRYFDKAAERIDVYEQQSKTKLGREAMATMTTPQNMPYEGRSYDKIMLHTYAALNYLTQGEVDKARPEIIHAYQCQQDAVADNASRIEDAQEAEKIRREWEHLKTDAESFVVACENGVFGRAESRSE